MDEGRRSLLLPTVLGGLASAAGVALTATAGWLIVRASYQPAILTLLGYSMNDTIIIFDRVREDLRQKRKEPLRATLNRAINETLPRSILTHATTLAATLALLIFAGLQTIPETMYEAGRMDGASEPRMFRSITVPLLRPVLALVLIITVVGSFQVFDTVAIATRGGPVDSSRVLQFYIYDVAFGRFQFGYASAMSVALLLVLVVITFIQYRVTRADSSDLN